MLRGDGDFRTHETRRHDIEGAGADSALHRARGGALGATRGALVAPPSGWFAARAANRNPSLQSGGECLSDQRFENWVPRRALRRPTFLRSTSRASRVTKPALRNGDLRVSS